MNHNHTGGWMLVAGCAAGLVTMALHPTAHPGVTLSGVELAALARLDRIVHGLALTGITSIFLGALALTRHLARGGRLALAALAVYGLATTAIIVAGTMDGFVAADLLDRLAAGDPKSASWWLLLDYNTRVVVAFASVYSVGACAAIFLWSAVVVRTRWSAVLGWYGLVVSPVMVLAVCSGHLALDKHGFSLVLLTQSVWFILAGWRLRRSVDAPEQPDRSIG